MLERHLTAKPPTACPADGLSGPIRRLSASEFGLTRMLFSKPVTNIRRPILPEDGQRLPKLKARSPVPGQVYFPVTQLPPQVNQPPIVYEQHAWTRRMWMSSFRKIPLHVSMSAARTIPTIAFLARLSSRTETLTYPRRLGQITDPRAWRGGGKTFRR